MDRQENWYDSQHQIESKPQLKLSQQTVELYLSLSFRQNLVEAMVQDSLPHLWNSHDVVCNTGLVHTYPIMKAIVVSISRHLVLSHRICSITCCLKDVLFMVKHQWSSSLKESLSTVKLEDALHFPLGSLSTWLYVSL